MTLVPWLLITAGLVVVILHQRVLDRRLARIERALKLRRSPSVPRPPVVVGSLHQVLEDDWTPPPQAWVQGHPVSLPLRPDEQQALLDRHRARMAEPGYRESLVDPPPPPATRSLLTVKHLARLHTPLQPAGG